MAKQIIIETPTTEVEMYNLSNEYNTMRASAKKRAVTAVLESMICEHGYILIGNAWYYFNGEKCIRKYHMDICEDCYREQQAEDEQITSDEDASSSDEAWDISTLIPETQEEVTTEPMQCSTCHTITVLDIDQDESGQCWDCRHPQEETPMTTEITIYQLKDKTYCQSCKPKGGKRGTLVLSLPDRVFCDGCGNSFCELVEQRETKLIGKGK